jgi:hypothetical protein
MRTTIVASVITLALGGTALAQIEPPRVCRRLQILRDWSHGESQDFPEVLSGGA